MVDRDPYGVQRRVVGMHDFRLEGLTDLTLRARGASVLDLGCNRGMTCVEFANNGATHLYGCDNYAKGIETAREIFADMRSVTYQFEVCDLTGGPESLRVFGSIQFDMVLMLATYHKLKRKMSEDLLSDLIKDLGSRTKRYFAWRGTRDQHAANNEEILALDRDLGSRGLTRIHTSHISTELGVAAIWAR
jgi:SAM-dependent methyltransferase